MSPTNPEENTLQPDEVLKARLWSETIEHLHEQYPRHNTTDEYNNIFVETILEQIKDTARILEVLCHHRDGTMVQARDWDALRLIRGIKQ